MSSMYIHTPDMDIECKPFFYFQTMVIGKTMTLGLLSPYIMSREEWDSILPPDCHVREVDDSKWEHSYRSWMNASVVKELNLPGEPTKILDVIFNTMMQVGNRRVRLLATVMAQCELYGYYPADQGPELTEILQDVGAEFGLHLRRKRYGPGPDELVCDLLRGLRGPFVMSYSTSGSFPKDFLREEGVENIDDMDREERWGRAMARLPKDRRHNLCGGLNYHAGNGMSALDIRRHLGLIRQ